MQLLGLVRRGLAVDRAVLDLAVVHLARLFGKSPPNIIGVSDEMFAQFLQLPAELALLRRHHGDRRGNVRLRRFRGALNADGCDDAGPSGIGADADASPRLFVPATRGAMIAFSTLVELQTGQLTSPRFTHKTRASRLGSGL